MINHCRAIRYRREGYAGTGEAYIIGNFSIVFIFENLRDRSVCPERFQSFVDLVAQSIFSDAEADSVSLISEAFLKETVTGLVRYQEAAQSGINSDRVDSACLQILECYRVSLVYFEACKCVREICAIFSEQCVGGSSSLNAHNFTGEIVKRLYSGIIGYQDHLAVYRIRLAPAVIVLTAFNSESGPDTVTASCLELGIFSIPVEGDCLVFPAEGFAYGLTYFHVKSADGAVVTQVRIGGIVKVEALFEGKGLFRSTRGSSCASAGAESEDHACSHQQSNYLFHFVFLVSSCLSN